MLEPDGHLPAAWAAGALCAVTLVPAGWHQDGSLWQEAEGRGARRRPPCKPGPLSGGPWGLHRLGAEPGCRSSSTSPRAERFIRGWSGVGRWGKWPRPLTGPPSRGPAQAQRLYMQLCVMLSIILAETWVGNVDPRDGLWNLSLCLPQGMRMTGRAPEKPGRLGLRIEARLG